MQEPIWVQKETVADLHPRLIRRYGGVDGVRSADLLESALSRPLNLQHYNPSASLFDLAAAYSFGIARNHPFADGNKRTAFVVSALFLELNGYRLQADDSEATRMFQALAAGEVEEHALSVWFQQHTVPLAGT